MQLAIAKALFGLDVAGLRSDFHVAVGDSPFRGTAVLFRNPMGEILAVEQNDSVRRRLAGRILCARSSWRDDRRIRTVAVVNFPLGIDLGGRRSRGQSGYGT